jgi:hypothetical protein
MTRTGTSIQTSLFPVANPGLFSTNYLTTHLPESSAWSQFDSKLEAILASVRDAFRVAGELKLGPGEEGRASERNQGDRPGH